MVALFNQSASKRIGPAAKAESAFSFLEREGRKEAIPLKEGMERWFSYVPKEEQLHLRKSLKAKQFPTFMSALFELELHEIFRRMNLFFEYPSQIGNGNRDNVPSIDFRIKEGESVYFVEATVCFTRQDLLRSMKHEEDIATRLRKELEGDLARAECSVFLQAEGQIKDTLTREDVKDISRKIKDAIAEFSDSLTIAGHSTKPRGISWGEHKHGEWTLSGRLFPSNTGYVHFPARVLGDGVGPLRSSLKRKASDWQTKKKKVYGQDFLIAINCLDINFYEDNLISAIYGTPSIPSPNKPFLPYLEGVNGVLAFFNATLGRERDAPVRLFQNGHMQIPQAFEPLLHGKQLEELLGLSEIEYPSSLNHP